MHGSPYPPSIETPEDILSESNLYCPSIQRPSGEIDQAFRLPMKKEFHDFMDDSLEDVVVRLNTFLSSFENEILSLANPLHPSEFPILAIFSLDNDIRSFVVYLISNELFSTVASQLGLIIIGRQRKDLTRLVIDVSLWHPLSYSELEVPFLNFTNYDKSKIASENIEPNMHPCIFTKLDSHILNIRTSNVKFSAIVKKHINDLYALSNELEKISPIRVYA